MKIKSSQIWKMKSEEMTAIHYLNQDNAVFERTEAAFILFLRGKEVGQDSGDSSVSIY